MVAAIAVSASAHAAVVFAATHTIALPQAPLGVAGAGPGYLDGRSLGRRGRQSLRKGWCSTTRSGEVLGHGARVAGVGRTRYPPTHGPGVPSGNGHCTHTGAGAVRCVQVRLAARSRGRRARAGRRICRTASAPVWSRHRLPRQVGAPRPASLSYLLTALGDLSCIVVKCIGWSAARANVH